MLSNVSLTSPVMAGLVLGCTAVAMPASAVHVVEDGLDELNGPDKFPRLINADIPGAPKLGQPQLIMGSTAPVVGRQHGLAAPSVFDWNGDGKKDLLIGEFETGECWVRVYLNVGTDAQPQFTDEFEYAHTVDGERMKVQSW